MKRISDHNPMTGALTGPPAGGAVLHFPASAAQAVARVEESIGALYHRMWAKMREYAAQYVSEDDADDIVQRAFIEIWDREANDPDRRSRVSPEAMLFRSVRFRVIDFRRNRRTMRENLVLYLGEIGGRMHAWMRPDAGIDGDRMASTIDRAIAAMTDRSREVYVMHYKAGFTAPEIAELTGVSVETVRTLLARANRVVRQHLEKAGFGSESRRAIGGGGRRP